MADKRARATAQYWRWHLNHRLVQSDYVFGLAERIEPLGEKVGGWIELYGERTRAQDAGTTERIALPRPEPGLRVMIHRLEVVAPVKLNRVGITVRTVAVSSVDAQGNLVGWSPQMCREHNIMDEPVAWGPAEPEPGQGNWVCVEVSTGVLPTRRYGLVVLFMVLTEEEYGRLWQPLLPNFRRRVQEAVPPADA